MIRNMSENVIIPPIKPFHSLIFGGTDLNSEISSYIIVAETSPPMGRAFPILILRSFFDRLLSNHKTNGKFKYITTSNTYITISNTYNDARITVIIKSMITCCSYKKGKIDLKKSFNTGE